MTGTYSVTVVDDNGCLQSDEIVVDIITVDNGVSLSDFTITSDQIGATYQWLDCDADYAEVDGETGISYAATANGNYAVEVTIGECVDTSDCAIIEGLSIDENDIANKLFTIYPNPNSGDFNIVLSDLEGEVLVKITSVEGKTIQAMNVMSNQSLPISIEDASGIYFVEVIHNQTSQIIKVIVQ
ncbi:T9SS type A sorting domain-containing protein [Crocinitomix sp.]|nr:T9SS type A sorting domain-containing protein [Crocinitomix sp.]